MGSIVGPLRGTSPAAPVGFRAMRAESDRREGTREVCGGKPYSVLSVLAGEFAPEWIWEVESGRSCDDCEGSLGVAVTCEARKLYVRDGREWYVGALQR